VTSDLDRSRVERLLAASGSPFGRPLVLMSTTESTNDEAKRAAREGVLSGALFVAEAQTKGRGRFGRAWHSPEGENLYASFVLRPALPPNVVPSVTLAAGLAALDAIAPRVAPRAAGLKWPNDVLVDDRKIAGILSEAQMTDGKLGWLVVGIGINVRTGAFPGELAQNATSLALSGARDLDRSALLVDLSCALSRRLDALAKDGLADLVRQFSAKDALLGRSITIEGSPAVALGIAGDGSLRVRRPDGTERSFAAGEVSLGSLRDGRAS
jgi:BirA family biotin operon repressor/biotin-[acetyl-CoA-carboxylase] ligase